jgi:hypothetical protein
MEESNLHVSRASFPAPRRGQGPPDHLNQEVKGPGHPGTGGPPPHVLAVLPAAGQSHSHAEELALHTLHGNQKALQWARNL